MLSVEEAKLILGQDGTNLSDEKVEKLVAILTSMFKNKIHKFLDNYIKSNGENQEIF